MAGKNEKLTFGKAFSRLKEISELLEDQELELEKAQELVEEAKMLEKICREKLSAQKLKITKLFEEEK